MWQLSSHFDSQNFDKDRPEITTAAFLILEYRTYSSQETHKS
jgi:hypothetical protein